MATIQGSINQMLMSIGAGAQLYDIKRKQSPEYKQEQAIKGLTSEAQTLATQQEQLKGKQSASAKELRASTRERQVATAQKLYNLSPKPENMQALLDITAKQKRATATAETWKRKAQEKIEQGKKFEALKKEVEEKYPYLPANVKENIIKQLEKGATNGK